MGTLENRAGSIADGGEVLRAALSRILESAEFHQSPRMSQLLRYLVEATLADRAGELKETVIGVEVFGRPVDYDPKVDPVVRTEVRRLRLKLQEYYQGSGSGDSTRIEIAKGGYVPGLVTTPAAPLAEVEATPAAAAERRWLKPAWTLVAATVLMLLAGSLVAVRLENRGPVLVPQPLTSNGGDEGSPALSRDGKQIAFAWESPADDAPAIYVQPLHGGTARRLTSSTSYENYPAWSPDGASIAFVRRTEAGAYAVCIRRLSDGAEQVLAEIHAPDPLDWSPDGREIATSDGESGSPPALILLNVANGGRRQITIPSPGAGDTFPRFSPDGSHIAFLRAVAVDVAEVYLLDLKSPENPTRLTSENRKIEGYTWAPDGRSLVISLARGATARSLWRLTLKGGAMERIDAAGTSVYTPVWAIANGALVFVQRRNDINLWRVRTDGSAPPVMVAGSSVLDSCPAFSPDGMRIAFRSTRSGTNEVWLTGLFGNTATRLTWINGPLAGRPSWSPDGKWIAFDSRVTGRSDVLLVPAAGGKWRSVTTGGSNHVIPSWSHDGQWIYFGSDRSGRWQVWKQRPDGSAAEQVTWRGGYAAAESPDGAYLYYTRHLSETGLFRMPARGGEEESVLPSLAGKLWGNWAVTNDGVYFLDYPAIDPSTRSTIRYLDLRTKDVREVFRLPKHPVLWDGGLALSPDGQWLVFAELDYQGNNIQFLEPFR